MVMAPLGKPDQPELSASAGFHVIPAGCCLMSPDLQLQPAAGEEGLRQARHRFVQGSRERGGPQLLPAPAVPVLVGKSR